MASEAAVLAAGDIIMQHVNAPEQAIYKAARAALEAAEKARGVNYPEIPDGWKLVPPQITHEMADAYFGVVDKNMTRVQTDARFGRYDSQKEAYRAMLAASPEPTKE